MSSTNTPLILEKTSHDDLVKALERIAELSKPGQTVSVSQAVDLLCDVWNAATIALANHKSRQIGVDTATALANGDCK